MTCSSSLSEMKFFSLGFYTLAFFSLGTATISLNGKSLPSDSRTEGVLVSSQGQASATSTDQLQGPKNKPESGYPMKKELTPEKISLFKQELEVNRMDLMDDLEEGRIHNPRGVNGKLLLKAIQDSLYNLRQKVKKIPAAKSQQFPSIEKSSNQLESQNPQKFDKLIRKELDGYKKSVLQDIGKALSRETFLDDFQNLVKMQVQKHKEYLDKACQLCLPLNPQHSQELYEFYNLLKGLEVLLKEAKLLNLVAGELPYLVDQKIQNIDKRLAGSQNSNLPSAEKEKQIIEQKQDLQEQLLDLPFEKAYWNLSPAEYEKRKQEIFAQLMKLSAKKQNLHNLPSNKRQELELLKLKFQKLLNMLLGAKEIYEKERRTPV